MIPVHGACELNGRAVGVLGRFPAVGSLPYGEGEAEIADHHRGDEATYPPQTARPPGLGVS